MSNTTATPDAPAAPPLDDAAFGSALLTLARPPAALRPHVLDALRQTIARRLPDLALRLACAGGADQRAELGPILARLESMPAAEESPDAVASRFERQAAELLSGRPHLARALDTARAIMPDLHVWRTPAGNAIVLHARGSGDRGGRLAADFVDGRARAAAGGPLGGALDGGRPTFVLPALPVAARLHHQLEQRDATGFRPPIDVVERNLVRFAARLASEEYGDELRDARLAVYAGPRADLALAEAARSRPSRRPGTAIVRDSACTDREHHAIAVIVRRAAREHLERRRADERILRDQHDGRDAAWWRRRWQERTDAGLPLRVRLFASRFEPDSAVRAHWFGEALRALGHDATVHGEPADWSAIIDYGAALRDGETDLIVLFDQVRRQETLIPDNVPVLSWFHDGLALPRSSELTDSIGPLDLLAVPSVADARDQRGYPAARLITSAPRTWPPFWSHPNAPCADGPIVYIGDGSETPDALARRCGRGPIAEAAGAYVAAVHAALVAGRWLSRTECTVGVLDIAARCSISLDPDERTAGALVKLARTLFDRAVRHQTLEWAAAWATRRGRELRIVGRGWDAHPTLWRWAAPPADDVHARRDALASSAAVINASGTAGLQPSFLDAVATGCVVLTRRTPHDAWPLRARAIATHLAREHARDLPAVFALARRDASFRALLEEHDAILGLPTARADDPMRVARLHRLLEARSVARHLATDAGLVAQLRSGSEGHVPTLLEIAGIEPTLFEDEVSLHDRLDATLADPAGAVAQMMPIRTAVARDHSVLDLARTALDRFFASS